MDPIFRVFGHVFSFTVSIVIITFCFDYLYKEAHENPQSEVYFDNHRSDYECISLDTTFNRFGTKCYVLTCRYLPDDSIYDFYVDVSTYLEYGGTL